VRSGSYPFKRFDFLAVRLRFGDVIPGTSEKQSRASGEVLQELADQCTALVKQAAFVPQRSDIRQRLLSLKAQIKAELAAALDFELVGTLGMQRKSLEQQSAQLPLSEEDYLTLGNRHADLVRRVTETCRELMKARDYAMLGPLSAKLKELKALDLSGILGTRHESDGELDPVVVAAVGRDDHGEYDPVIVAPGGNG
jgi:hypothetical protein